MRARSCNSGNFAVKGDTFGEHGKGGHTKNAVEITRGSLSVLLTQHEYSANMTARLPVR